MKKQILSIGKELTKSEQSEINGGFGEGCSPHPLLGPCTSDSDCKPMYPGLPATCEFGCCLTPIC